MSGRRALVVGGGVTGLAAAVELVDLGWDVALWEASDELGGKVRTSPFAGRARIDEGADAYLTRVPHAVAFARRVGIDDVTSPTDASAAVWHDGLHRIPGGVLLGMPAAVRPFATTTLLSWRGKARAAAEPLLPRRDHGDSLGALVRYRFGDEVHERLVDSLVGSIYATDTDHSSLQAVPQLAQLASANRSLLIAGRRARARAAATPQDGPIFEAPRTGMGGLVESAAHTLRTAGIDLRTGRTVSSISGDGSTWVVDGERFDAVVLAAPAKAASTLLASATPDAAEGLATIEAADVTMVRLTIPAGDWPDHLLGRSGYLVPKPDQRYVTAASFGSQKWDHWRAADGSQLLRVSLGRDGLPVAHLDDDAVLRHTVDELGHHLGFDVQPTEISITRWVEAFPQYRPRHHERVDAIDRALPPGLALAGASYRGIGIPACVADGVRAARAVTPDADVPRSSVP